MSNEITLNDVEVALNVALNNDDKKQKKIVKTVAIFKMDNVETSEIIALAVKSLVIKYQAQIRDDYATFEIMKDKIDGEKITVDVAELLIPKKRVVDPFKQSMKLASKQDMNDDQLATLINELKGQLKSK